MDSIREFFLGISIETGWTSMEAQQRYPEVALRPVLNRAIPVAHRYTHCIAYSAQKGARVASGNDFPEAFRNWSFSLERHAILNLLKHIGRSFNIDVHLQAGS
jgi:hypothetical protein